MTHPGIRWAEATGGIEDVSYDDKERWYEVRDREVEQIEKHVMDCDGEYEGLEDLYLDSTPKEYKTALYEAAFDRAYAELGICPGCHGW